MAICLNTESANKMFDMMIHDEYYVDKSGIIEKVNARINSMNRYICVTKPRRFGKTSVVNMLGAYYCKTYDASALFEGLKISESKTYKTHLNQYNVISLCMNRLPDHGNTYDDYIGMVMDSIIGDIYETYPELNHKKFSSISDMLAATGNQFIFMIDEWDYIFSHDLYKENQGDFLEFLRNLLKDQPYVALAYMTGVLPIKKYSIGSALNMFDEYTMLNDTLFDEYFGFTEEEVVRLCNKQSKLTQNEIAEWYDGYLTENAGRIYNPRSVVLALINGKCQSYWTRTGKMDEVLFFLKYNIGEIRDDVVKMVNGISVSIFIEEEYSAGQGEPKRRKEIYGAMIIYGLLSYHDGELRIPNKELMLEFQKALKDENFSQP